MDLKGRKTVVVGLARSGVGAANLLARFDAVVTVTDRKQIEELGSFADALDPVVNLSLGGHPAELFNEADLIVLSPGVPADIAPLKAASANGAKIIGELELAYQIISDQQSAVSNQNGNGKLKTEFLAVTGTNGKSTTTTLLYEMLRRGGFNSSIAGNIGNAVTEEIMKAISDQPSASGSECTADSCKLKADFIVTEVSSFQLETIDEFRPKGATILNITPDHMDRYHSPSDYIDAKCRVFLNQKEGDFLVLNADDQVTGEIIKRGRRLWGAGEAPDIFYFSRRNRVKGAYLEAGIIQFDIPGLVSGFALSPGDFRIRGVHNIENAMAASLMALLSGCSPDAVAGALKDFPGLEHRLEFVREVNGIDYINDSKGTNVGAVIKSLESFDRPIVLIAGGRDKAGDFSALSPFIKEKVKALILIGEAAEKIRKASGDTAEVFMEADLATAVSRAGRIASGGDVVLLSPACASFDMFRDFEDRGRQFKKLVMEL